MNKEVTFALYFGNRGFFPGELIADARRELAQAVTDAGYGYLMADEEMTRYGAVETIQEGKRYAAFLEEHRGEFQGVILCLPNFGDENGAMVALENCNVPILVEAYRDEAGKMDFTHRRDAVCGKIAMCNVLRQHKLRYTLFEPFACNPTDPEFAAHIEKFAAVCRVVNGMKRFNIGAIGARTTAFKTVRFDEIAMQSAGVNVETIDLSEVFARMEQAGAERVEQKTADYLRITDFGSFPPHKLETIARIGVVVDDLIQEYDLQGIALRCWNEFETTFGVAPCLVLCDLNERGIAASCELDVNNTVMTRAILLAAAHPAMLLDVNNNYGTDPDRCILFHCGPVPISMTRGKGVTIEHLMFRKSFGEGSGVGVNKVQIAPGPVTFGSLRTEAGRLCAFVSEGELTEDPIEEAFFGSGIVLKKDNVQGLLKYMGTNGFRHHVCLTKGHVAEAVQEALINYLGYDLDRV